jgi:hypothetical protein
VGLSELLITFRAITENHYGGGKEPELGNAVVLYAKKTLTIFTTTAHVAARNWESQKGWRYE